MNTETYTEVEKNNDSVEEIKLTPVLTSRRIASSLVDLFLLIVGFLLIVTIAFPVGSNIADYEGMSNQYITLISESNLYLYKQATEGNSEEEATSEDYLEIREYYANAKISDQWKYINKLDEHLISFYTNEIFEDVNIETYNQSKIESNLFEVNNGILGKYKDSSSIDSLITFFDSEVDKALTLWSHDENVLNVSRSITVFTIVIFLISLFIPLTIFYLVLPLCLKNRATLGKKITSIGVVNRKTGILASKTQILVRFLAFAIIEVALSFLLSGFPITLLISFTMMCFTKTGNTIHDYFAGTICVDTRDGVIYSSQEEYFESKRLHFEDINLTNK